MSIEVILILLGVQTYAWLHHRADVTLVRHLVLYLVAN